MKLKINNIWLAVWLLALAGCSTTQSPSATQPGLPPAAALPPTAVPMPADTQAALPMAAPEEAPLQPGGEAPQVLEPEPRPVMSANRAVVALLDRAELDSKAGKREAAGASLERALRIEPRNPWLWQELAQVRLAQGQYAQAITLAKKSSSFGGRQPRLQAANWQVIGQAKVAQGDTAGAEQAFKQAAELAQQARLAERAPAAEH